MNNPTVLYVLLREEQRRRAARSRPVVHRPDRRAGMLERLRSTATRLRTARVSAPAVPTVAVRRQMGCAA